MQILSTRFCRHQPTCELDVPCRDMLNAAEPNIWHIEACQATTTFIIEQPLKLDYTYNRDDATKLVRELSKMPGCNLIEFYYNHKLIERWTLKQVKPNTYKWNRETIAKPERVSTKTVFSLGEIFHVWAHQSRPEGRTPSSSGRGNWYSHSHAGPTVYFEGTRIWSYGSHFCIAQIVNLGSDNCYVLMNNEKTTPTTNQHRSDARSAVRQHTVLDVPYVDAVPSHAHGWEFQNERNINHFIEAINVQLVKAKQNKKRAHEAFKSALNSTEKLIQYCQVVGLELPTLPWTVEELQQAINESKAVFDAYQAQISDRAGKAQDTKYAMRRIRWELGYQEADRIRALPKRERSAEIARILPNLDELARQKREAYERQRELEAQQEALRLPIAMQSWREGLIAYEFENNTYQVSSVLHKLPTMLRVRGNEVQTSRGAIVPLSAAKQVLSFIFSLLPNGPDDGNLLPVWTGDNNNNPVRIGNYKLDAVLLNGTIKVGCHTIAWTELVRLSLTIAELDS